MSFLSKLWSEITSFVRSDGPARRIISIVMTAGTATPPFAKLRGKPDLTIHGQTPKWTGIKVLTFRIQTGIKRCKMLLSYVSL